MCNFTNLTISGSAQRIKFSVTTPRSGEVNQFTLPEFGSKPQDILIDGMNMENGNARVFLNGDRVAVINSRLDVGSGTMSAYVIPQGTPPCSDTIIANCELVGPGSADSNCRVQGTSQFIFVDNRMAQTVGNYNTWRLHTISYDGSGTDMNAWVAGNQFEGTRLAIIDQCCGTSASGGPHLLNDIYFNNNTFYMTSANSSGVAINTSYTGGFGYDNHIQSLTLNDNDLYSSSAGTWVSGSQPFSGSGNTAQGYVSPPTWSFA